ncbi:MAG: sensor histidine kinase [Chloroflexi bacterium]|nr:sensor histidine kinase [Chloroflexota bacterium]
MNTDRRHRAHRGRVRRATIGGRPTPGVQHAARADTNEAARLRREMLLLIEEERRRVARELHDEAGQALTASIFRIDLCVNTLPPDTEEQVRERIVAELQAIRTMLFDCSRQLHRLTLNLRPPMLEDLGLVATVQWFVRQCTNQYRLPIELTIDPGIPPSAGAYSPIIETTVFRIVQESLTNVARHAQATLAQVQLTRASGELSVVVVDNGRGFAVEQPRNKTTGRISTGLIGMRERARLLGGTLEVSSIEGRGTMVRLRIPLHSAEHSADWAHSAAAALTPYPSPPGTRSGTAARGEGSPPVHEAPGAGHKVQRRFAARNGDRDTDPSS